MTLLLVITWLCVFIVIIGLFYYVWDDRNKRKLHEHRRVEISELAMIFQTLRDVVSEQKILAKEFNEQVEEKISLIRGIVNEAQNRMKKIQQEIYEQSKKLKELQEQMDEIFRQEDALKNVVKKDIQTSETISIIEAESICEELANKTEAEKEETDFSNEINDKDTEEKYKDIEGSEYSYLRENKNNLQGNFPEKVDSENVKEKNEKMEDFTEDPKNIKNAYQSLLVGSVNERKQTERDLIGRDSQKGELTPVQKMVLEYHQSGMTTGEIAKELGITKGEVRLILSLAISKRNQT